MTDHTGATTEVAAPRVTQTQQDRWAVRIVHSPDQRAVDRLLIAEQPLRLGRQPGGGRSGRLEISDPRLSRSHAVFAPARHGLRIEDQGSRNGTFVGGAQVAEAPLSEGDVVRVGDTLLVVTRHSGGGPVRHGDLGLFGRSPSITKLRDVLRRVAPSELSVLVTGPTGTGKELVARALHELSGRSGRLVPVNCAALPDALVESTLFGHRKGAFTGATASEDGAFVTASGGTLFLDEIGEMAIAAQPKLLRTLETREVTPVGASRPRPVDVRVVAATNRELTDEIGAEAFREDLYARIAGVTVRTPPLRERREDVLLLLSRFLPEPLRERPQSAGFAEALLLYPWPLNVRELRQLADRLSVLHPDAPYWDEGMLDPAFLRRVGETDPEDASALTAPSTGGDDAHEGIPERDEIVALLTRCKGNVSKVADLVGRNRRQVYRWMEIRGIPRGTGR